MSSLAASRADNFYFPPDFDPSKGGLNAQQGTHALGKRAKHIDQGVLTIRFEAPYHIWCSGCGFKISKGCRFNAQKKAVGHYHSTKIWSFKMVTPCCANNLEIHTDPKTCEYIVVVGGTKKVEEYLAEDAETAELEDKKEIEKRRDDPFQMLEYGGADKQRAEASKPAMQRLLSMSERGQRDYSLNKSLRRAMRTQRKAAAELDEERKAKGMPEHIRLLPASESDLVAARNMRSAAGASSSASRPENFRAMDKLRRAAIQTSSIFSTPGERRVPTGALLGVAGSQLKKTHGQSSARRVELLAKRQRLQSALKDHR
mmetsp:Transcript_37256/g.71434  ORF Transcript_37256/g.71434 Transcript_37256/m.71434 type:complete len:315 (+) Transcript_37256:66-1010(+)